MLSQEKNPFEEALFIFNSISAEEIVMVYHGGKLSVHAEKFIQTLRKQTTLNEPVINVLIDYTMKTNESRLSHSLCKKTAQLLERYDIQTAEEAMHFLREYYHTYIKVAKSSLTD